MGRLLFLVVTLAGLSPLMLGCQPKVPIVDVGAFFQLADVTWYEEEETLFVFFRVDSELGLSDASEIEISWVTDSGLQGFAPLESFTPVHRHVDADCGVHTFCGSWSIPLAESPTNVALRLRFHRDGELTLDAPVTFQRVLRGPPHTNRSALVYGVFDEDNRVVQWRLRHTFPGVRNELATDLGLRRTFTIEAVRSGDVGAAIGDLVPDNPYGYGVIGTCPETFPLAFVDDVGPDGAGDAVTTDARAFLAPLPLPQDRVTHSHACAESTVEDATGTVTTAAFAQKNPEVDPAFGALRTPVNSALKLGFFLERCSVEIVDVEARTMMLQRLQLDEGDVLCIDDADTDGFVTRLADRLQETIDLARVDDDMVLVLGLHRADNDRIAATRLEQALDLVLDNESVQASPRLAGVFVFDSLAYSPTRALVNRHTIWCPAGFGGSDLEEISDVPARSCAVQQDQTIQLGPLSLSSIPIFPTRAQYRTFIDRFSVAQAGRMNGFNFRAPSRTTTSQTIPFSEFGVATFFNNEAITVDADDALSFCFDENLLNVVFLPPTEASEEPLPIQVLPDFHAAFPQPRYPLGLAWDSPYLARFRYTAVAAIGVTVAELTVPFGIESPAEVFEGSFLWDLQSFDLTDALIRCDRFCRHPTFDSAGIYNVLLPFAPTFHTQCYRPSFAQVGAGGFPRDP